MWSLLILVVTLCFTHSSFGSSTSHCKSNDDPNTDCIGAYFVQTDGKIQQCIEHKDCYDYREPILWCRPNPEQKWMKDGCHCDLKLHSCIINRQSYGRLEYTHCRSAFNWKDSFISRLS
ncbi:Chromadorea ALT family protein [Brugia pahangi]